jgi:hypothetical protein
MAMRLDESFLRYFVAPAPRRVCVSFTDSLAVSYAARRLIRAGLLSTSCRGKIRCVRNRRKRRHGPTFDFRIVRRHGDARFLRTGKAQPLVHPGVCRSLRARLGLRVSSGSLAVRFSRSRLVRGCVSPLVDERQFEITNRLRRYDQKIIHAMGPAAQKNYSCGGRRISARRSPPSASARDR